MKILLISLLSALILSASDINNHKIKILEKIITEISIDKELIVWSDNQIILNELRNHNKLRVSNKCEDASIIILEKQGSLKCDGYKLKHVFVLNYNLLSKIPQSFGALFWKKGRPNIVIIEPKIKSQSIKISKNLEPYLEEKIW